jgi:hypothetical protein
MIKIDFCSDSVAVSQKRRGDCSEFSKEDLLQRS